MTGQKVEAQCGGGDPALGAVAMDERPKYLALARLVLEPGWIEVKPGSEFEHDGPATNGMNPLNRSARKAKLASIGPRWREKRQAEIFRLARSLGFSHGTDAEASAHIEEFIRETERETTHDDH